MTKPLRHTTIALAALLAAAAVGIVAPAASASPAALQTATSHCWLDVINDWLDNNQVDRIYAIPCYTQAIQHLAALPDVSGYSSAMDDIHRALLAAVRQDRNDGPGGSSGGGGPSSGSNGGSSGPTSGSDGGSPSSTGGGSNGILGIGGPTDATSIPLPLIILGALAVLLALAALATWLARRYQTRRPGRPAPAPAVAKRR
jgi:hypothetical protein